MNCTVVYYSYSGNTRKVAQILAEYLKQKGDTRLMELESLDEAKSFFGQCRRAFTHVRGQIETVNFDLTGSSIICFGSPVWALGPAPAMNTYLDKCAGLEGKQVILFTTFGSGTGNERCLNYMESLLAKKGAQAINKFSVQQNKIEDHEFVLSKIKAVVK
ncbi:MAG: NAD(P)H-dependent oxidoreductase [Candidatus Omnitrophica bacterium]|nr:NAD(P)H-dependent oxidoreductase [Candidatus Omnitrophota bacterium]